MILGFAKRYFLNSHNDLDQKEKRLTIVVEFFHTPCTKNAV